MRRVAVIGAGPAGLYSALLLKKVRPRLDVEVIERNPAGATYGWGVVFSDRTLTEFREADQPTFDAITDRFVAWDAIDIHYRDELVRSGGHVFTGIARVELLGILQRRCEELGVRLRFEDEVTDPEALGDRDLVVAADGVNSVTREARAKVFRPRLDAGASRYIWFGTDRILDSFTFVFRQNDHGLFQAHAYPFDGTTATWIVETDEDTWRRAGLHEATEEESIAYCEGLFSEELRGRRLMSNRSQWISFVTVPLTSRSVREPSWPWRTPSPWPERWIATVTTRRPPSATTSWSAGPSWSVSRRPRRRAGRTSSTPVDTSIWSRWSSPSTS
jgi:anthraniloyl-CoA monooxygenase